MHIRILLLMLFCLSKTHAVYVPLEIDNWGKILNKAWNGTTPLATSMKNNVDLILHISNTQIPFKKVVSKDFENFDHYTYYLEEPSILEGAKNICIEVKNIGGVWPFNSKKTKINYNNTTPKLSLISATSTVTHGGGGLLVLESENYDDLSMLAFIDDKKIPFYPKRFQKDGFYVILFTWYTDSSRDWTKQYVIAIDNAGNTNRLVLSAVKPKTRDYRQSVINLPPDYADQKAKELALSDEQAKKLEGNIDEINKVLAQQRTFSRWNETRTTFKKNAKEIVTKSTVFSNPAEPLKNSVKTATYGDQRKYYYQNQLVRQSVHRGLDFASTKNSPVYSLLDGEVVYADWYGGNGKSIVIYHGLNTYTLYAHNEELLVKEGQKVKAGEQISISGTTGQSTGDHLHLSVIVQGMYLEPEEWLTRNSIDRLFHNPLKEAESYIKNR